MIFYYLVVLFSAVPNHPWFGAEVGGGITVIKITGILALLSALIYLGMRKSFPAFFSAWPIRFYLILQIIVCVSFVTEQVGGVNFAGVGSPIMQYFSIGLLYFTTLTFVDSPVRLRRTLLALIGAVGIASLYALREWQREGFSGAFRVGWVAGDSNYLAAMCLLTLPLSYYLYREKGPRWERFFCLICLFMAVLAFVAASSRGGLVGLGLGFLYVLIRSRRRTTILVFALLLLPLMLLSPLSPIKRFTHPDYGDTVSVNTHKALWVAGLKAIEQNPITGLGLGAFKGTIRKTGALNEIMHEQGVGLMAHNTYLEYAAELGIPAFLLFCSFLLSTLLLLGKVRKRALAQGESFFLAAATGLQGGIVGFCGAAFFISAEYIKPFWIIAFLAPCMYSLLQQQPATDSTLMTAGRLAGDQGPALATRRGAPVATTSRQDLLFRAKPIRSRR